MGLELINHLGRLKMLLLGHRLSLGMEQLRDLLFPSPVSESVHVRRHAASTAPQEHHVPSLPQPHCFPHKQLSLLADQQPPNPSCQWSWCPPGGGWQWQVLFPTTTPRFKRHWLSMLLINNKAKDPALTGLSKIHPTAKCQIILVPFSPQ